MALAPVASADNGVRVKINGGGSVYLSGPDVDAARDVALDTLSTTRSSDGRESADGEGGTKVSTVAELAHIPAQFVKQMVIPRAASPGTVTLSGDEVRNGFSGDPSGEARFATIYTGYGHGVHFFRPMRDGNDANALDVIDTPNDGDLLVRLKTTNDAVRDVVSHAEDKTPKPNRSVGFSARVEDAPGGVTFTYSWDYGDGTTGSGPTPTHAFAKGHYNVTVTAVGSDGSSGVADPVGIQVGKPKKQPDDPLIGQENPPPTGGTGNGGSGGSGGGGGHQQGGGEGSPNAPASGPASGSGTGTGQSPSGTPTTAPAPPVQGVSPKAPGTPTPAQSQPPATSGTVPAPSGGVPVNGIVLADPGDPTAADEPETGATQPAAERSPSRSGGGGGGRSIAGWVGGAAMFVLLLGLGAARETGRRLRWTSA